eukprot:6506837-Prymnesium_polylepis.1
MRASLDLAASSMPFRASLDLAASSMPFRLRLCRTRERSTARDVCKSVYELRSTLGLDPVAREAVKRSIHSMREHCQGMEEDSLQVSQMVVVRSTCRNVDEARGWSQPAV